MSLVLSDSEVLATGLTETELRRELALVLYQQQRISLNHASSLCGIPRMAFRDLLAERRIPVQYTVDDLHEDLRSLAELSPR